MGGAATEGRGEDARRRTSPTKRESTRARLKRLKQPAAATVQDEFAPRDASVLAQQAKAFQRQLREQDLDKHRRCVVLGVEA